MNDGQRVLGRRYYELKNHLGNVMTVVSDDITRTESLTRADVVSVSDYYPFGLEHHQYYSVREDRNEAAAQRYDFNGKERDNSFGNVHYDYGFRIYNPSIGKFLSMDPLTKSYPMLTPYQFASNSPIMAIDLDGLEAMFFMRAMAGEYGETAQKVNVGVGEGVQLISDQAMSLFQLETWARAGKEASIKALTYVVTDGSPFPGDRFEMYERHGIVTLGPDEYAGIYNDMKTWNTQDWSRNATLLLGTASIAMLTRNMSISGFQYRRLLGGRGALRMKGTPSIPIRKLDYTKVRFSDKGVDVVEKHLSRFGSDGPNEIMVERLRKIAKGDLEATDYDYKFYTHELRESSRFKKGGYENGMAPDDFYNTQHGATLEDYDIPDNPKELYHPDAQSHPDF